jgi:hypothetical protein
MTTRTLTTLPEPRPASQKDIEGSQGLGLVSAAQRQAGPEAPLLQPPRQRQAPLRWILAHPHQRATLVPCPLALTVSCSSTTSLMQSLCFE